MVGPFASAHLQAGAHTANKTRQNISLEPGPAASLSCTLLHGKENICKLFHMYSKLNRHKVNFISVYLSANPTAIKLFRCQNLKVIYK